MIQYFKLIRVSQWVKNFFVFAPLFFSNSLFNTKQMTATLLTFLSFCFISSSIYCLNDLHDVEADRQHPKKCKRPIASRTISIRNGYITMMLCTLLSFSILAFVNNSKLTYLYIIIGGYWLMNIAYCLKLKHYAIIDVAIIAIGFVLRVLAGGFATDTWVSHWLVLMTFLLALLLAFTKRYDDFTIFEQTGTKPRVSITGYNKMFINEATAIVAAITMVCYIMYTMSEEVIARMGTRYLYITSGWVLAGILRYLQNMIVYNQSGSPTKSLIKDHFIHICVIGWLVSFFIIIYL
jgi:4-hydroxybenzoate polyprenyltransferase